MPNLSDALSDAFRRIGYYWITAIALVIATSFAITLINYPMAEFQVRIQNVALVDVTDVMAELNLGFLDILLLGLLQMFVFSGMLVIWLRTLLLGPDQVMNDGAYAFLTRTVYLMWRQITVIGWVVLLTFVPAFVFAFMGFGTGFVILYSFVVLLALLPAYGASMAAIAVDFPMTVRSAWATLGFNSLSLAGLAFGLLIIFSVIIGAIFIALFGTGEGLYDGPLTVSRLATTAGLQAVFQSIFAILWTAVCGVMLEHILAENQVIGEDSSEVIGEDSPEE